MATKKAAVRVTPKIGVTVPKMTLDLELDEKKIAAIQRCLKTGRLKVTVNKVDFLKGRAGDPYAYD